MVNTVQWINSNLDEDAVIAAHDIGAMGCFSKSKIIDLVGLVTPEVIPFIRDEKQLGVYIHEQKEDYLVTFPSWNPELTSKLNILYTTEGIYAPQFGMDNMTLFEWRYTMVILQSTTLQSHELLEGITYAILSR